jgi:large subunit ribosomal protein L32e
VTNAKTAKRKKLKDRIPKIVRQESWRYKRIGESWRKPTGVSNKMRRRQRGWPKSVSIGYKTTEELRHLHPCGLREVVIHRPTDLEKIDPKNFAVRIGHTVGEKKRVAILDRARELEIKVLNPGTPRRQEALEEKQRKVEPAEPEKEPEQPEVTEQSSEPQEEEA